MPSFALLARTDVALGHVLCYASEVACRCHTIGNLVMPAQQTIEQRLTEVERELAELKRRFPPQTDGKSWVERIAGTFKDDPDFDEIVRLGREFRQSVQ